jgi:hypothetical protein
MGLEPGLTPSAKVTPRVDSVGASLNPELVESPKSTPSSPQSLGLGSAGGSPLGGDSTRPQLGGPSQ